MQVAKLSLDEAMAECNKHIAVLNNHRAASSFFELKLFGIDYIVIHFLRCNKDKDRGTVLLMSNDEQEKTISLDFTVQYDPEDNTYWSLAHSQLTYYRSACSELQLIVPDSK